MKDQEDIAKLVHISDESISCVLETAKWSDCSWCKKLIPEDIQIMTIERELLQCEHEDEYMVAVDEFLKENDGLWKNPSLVDSRQVMVIRDELLQVERSDDILLELDELLEEKLELSQKLE